MGNVINKQANKHTTKDDKKSTLELAIERKYLPREIEDLLKMGRPLPDGADPDPLFFWSDDIMYKSFRMAIKQSNFENAQLLLKYGAYIPNDSMPYTMSLIQNKIDTTRDGAEKEKWKSMKQETLGFCFLHLLKENNPADIDSFLNTYSRMPIKTDIQDYLGNSISNTIEYINNPYIVDLLPERDNRWYHGVNGNNPKEQARNVDIAVTNLLLRHNIIKRGIGDYNPATYAAALGDELIICKLHEIGYNLNEIDESGNTPMTAAIWQRNEGVVELIHNLKPEAISLLDGNGYTPLTLAVERGEQGIVNFICEKDPWSITQVDKRLYTPLGTALKAGNVDMVRLLCEKGVDPTKFRNGGISFTSTTGFVQEKIGNTQGVERIKWQNMLHVLDDAIAIYQVNRGNHRAGGLDGLMDVDPDPQVQGNRVVENPENPRGNENEANHRAGGINGLIGVHLEGHQGGENQRHDGNGLEVVGRDRGAQQPPAVRGVGNQGNQIDNGIV